MAAAGERTGGYVRPEGTRAERLKRRVADLYDWAVKGRQDVELQWDEAERAFYDMGPQRLEEQNAWIGSFLSLPPPAPRVRAHVNICRPIVQQLVANICAEPLRFRVQPRSSEPEKAIAAIAGQAIVDYWKDALRFDVERERLALFVCLRSIGYVTYGFNFNAGPSDPLSPGDRLGEVFLRAVDPREILVDPSATDLRDASFIIRDRLVSVAALPRHLRPKGDATGSVEWPAPHERTSSAVSTIYGPDPDAGELRTARLQEVYFKPRSGHLDDEERRVAKDDDEGIFAMVVNGEVTSVGSNPYARDGVAFPLAGARYIEDAAHTYSAGIAFALTQKQAIATDLWGALIAHQKFARLWKLVAPKDADLKGRLVPEACEIIRYRATPEEFKWLAPPGITDADFTVPDKLLGMARFEAGATEVWAGESPERIGTATGLQIAKSGSELRARIVRRHVDDAIKHAVGDCLRIAASRYVQARLIELTGKSYPVRSMMVDGVGLDDLVVDIQAEPTFSSNPLLRIEQVLRLTSSTPPGYFSPEQVAEWLQIPQSETDLFAEKDLDRANADEQAWTILRGDVPPLPILIEPMTDDHKIYMDRYRIWLKTSVGRWARKMNPMGVAVILRAYAERAQIIAAATMGGVAMAQAQQGGHNRQGQQDLTPQAGGRSQAARTNGAGSESGAEALLGRTSPAVFNDEMGATLANRPRVTGGVT